MTDRELLEALFQDMQMMKGQIQTLDRKVTDVQLLLENETNRNVQILAENHCNLLDKLNQAIRVQDKSMLYEVQVSGLKMQVEKLEREIAEIKAKIA